MAIEFKYLATGKLDHDVLRQFLEKYTSTDQSVLAGARIGEDAAVIDMGDHFLVTTTDPITFTTEHVGYYAVHVNINDVVCLGATPKYFLATVLLAEKTTKSQAEHVFAQISAECDKQKIAYIGGHTEVTIGLDRSIVVGQLIAEVAKEKLLRKTNIKPNDAIIQINRIPIEGTAILAGEKYEKLSRFFSPEFAETCKNYLFDPGISVRSAAECALQTGKVKAMHDPTEGGLSTAVYELAQAADLGCIVHAENILYLTNGRLACEFFDIDPLGCLSSGALLAVVSPGEAEAFVAYLRHAGFPAARIGHFIEKDNGYILEEKGTNLKLPVYAKDEITTIF